MVHSIRVTTSISTTRNALSRSQLQVFLDWANENPKANTAPRIQRDEMKGFRSFLAAVLKATVGGLCSGILVHPVYYSGRDNLKEQKPSLLALRSIPPDIVSSSTSPSTSSSELRKKKQGVAAGKSETFFLQTVRSMFLLNRHIIGKIGEKPTRKNVSSRSKNLSSTSKNLSSSDPSRVKLEDAQISHGSRISDDTNANASISNAAPAASFSSSVMLHLEQASIELTEEVKEVDDDDSSSDFEVLLPFASLSDEDYADPPSLIAPPSQADDAPVSMEIDNGAILLMHGPPIGSRFEEMLMQQRQQREMIAALLEREIVPIVTPSVKMENADDDDHDDGYDEEEAEACKRVVIKQENDTNNDSRKRTRQEDGESLEMENGRYFSIQRFQ